MHGDIPPGKEMFSQERKLKGMNKTYPLRIGKVRNQHRGPLSSGQAKKEDVHPEEGKGVRSV